MPPARISLTLSCHFSLSSIASGRSSGLHPVSSHSCCMYVRAGCPAFAQPYMGVHRSISLMSLSLLLEQCLACLVHLTWIVFMMGGRWPYSWCLVGVAARTCSILLADSLPKETLAAITILYRNTKVKIHSPDGDTKYFDIVAGVPYLFIICLDYVLRTSIDKIRENSFKLTKKRSRRYPTKKSSV